MDEEIKQRLLKLFDSGAETIADLKVVAPEVWKHLCEEFASAHSIYVLGDSAIATFVLVIGGLIMLLFYRTFRKIKDGGYLVAAVLTVILSLIVSLSVFSGAVTHAGKAAAPSYYLLKEFM